MKGWPSAFNVEEQLRLISMYRVALEPVDIQEALCISKATYYRRLAEIKRRKLKPPEDNLMRTNAHYAFMELQARADYARDSRKSKKRFTKSSV